MKFREEGNLLIIQDRPLLMWAIGGVFSILLLFILLQPIWRFDWEDPFKELGLIINCFFIFCGNIVFFSSFPQITCVIDRYAQTVNLIEKRFFVEKSSFFRFNEIKKVELVSKEAWFLSYDQDKFRLEMVFRDGKRLPISSKWRMFPINHDETMKKFNSSLPKINQRKKEKLLSWKDEKIKKGK